MVHDIEFVTTDVKSDAPRVRATIQCERRDQTLDVESCRSCERFARVDVHEAGYVMLCRSEDEQLDDSDEH
ncbi:MAG TPA: hypothetical protein VJR89_01150 [Polyangiales bacterium]|nr:hypothetical protein [Polyangiales bacterium]